MIFFQFGISLSLYVLVSVGAHPQREQHSALLEHVANFDHQVTGVSIHAPSGRVFVNFPRWTEDSPISVAEVLSSNTIVPFPPQSDWNSWRNTKKHQLDPAKYFVCVQSVVVFQDSLYVLDPAAPAIGDVVKGGPKLVEIDLIKNETKRTILFDEEVVPQGSYLNDIRFSPDGKYAYITDSGIVGALLVVDLQQEKARRVLHGHPSTQIDKNVTVKHHGKVLRRSDGVGIEASADGIAVSVDGAMLYWQAVRGKMVYSVPTLALRSSSSYQEIAAQIKTIGENGPADGLWISSTDPQLLYVTSIEDDSIKVRNLLTNTYEVKLSDSRLRWPDTFAEDGQGYIYVTASRIQDSAWFTENAPTQLSTELWRFKSK